MLLWPAHALAQQPFRPWFVAALGLTALCGAVILAAALLDLLTVRRDRSVLPARMFNLVLGLLLTAPSSAALSELWH